MALKMIQQSYAKLDLSSPHQDEDVNKITRLAEVKKGADLTKVVNTLAEEQWRGNSVVPRIVETEEAAPIQKKINPSNFKYDEPQLLQTSTPIKAVSTTQATPLFSKDFSDRSTIGTVSREIRNIPSTRSSLLSYSDLQNDHSYVMNKIHKNRMNTNNNNNEINNAKYDAIVRRRPLLPDIAERDPNTSVDLQDLYFNTWGSRSLGLDIKLTDPVPRVRAPKPSIPSSRVAAKKQHQQLRTETDFRSRNGLVRIVKPFKPLPPISSFQYPYTGVPDDPENIGREKTYVTLKRIDRILNPQQAYLTGELNSSELEIIGSGSTTPVSDAERNPKHKKLTKRSNATYVNHSGGITVVHTYPPTRKNKIQTANTVPNLHKQSQSRSMSPILKSLECDKITSYEKCSKWIDKCSEWY